MKGNWDHGGFLSIGHEGPVMEAFELLVGERSISPGKESVLARQVALAVLLNAWRRAELRRHLVDSDQYFPRLDRPNTIH
jgi:hypothetical protein